jgi:hypothetical protein
VKPTWLGLRSISLKSLPINLYIVVQLLGQLSNETIHNTASPCGVTLTCRGIELSSYLDSHLDCQIWSKSLWLYESSEWITAYSYGLLTSYAQQEQPMMNVICCCLPALVQFIIFSYFTSGSLTLEMSALRGERVWAWHLTSILTPNHEINEYFFRSLRVANDP